MIRHHPTDGGDVVEHRAVLRVDEARQREAGHAGVLLAVLSDNLPLRGYL